LAAIFLSIALGVASVALREINFSTSAKDTNDAFFAADSGIEQALYNDKTSGFYLDNGKVSFTVPNLGSASQGCAYVTVDKTASPSVVITANGYNIGNGSCNSTNPNRVERELVTTYSGVTNYTVTGQAPGGNGSISPASQNINSGSPATLTASPSTGYSTSFSSTCGGTQSVNSFTISSVTAPCTVTASFSLNTYVVTPSAGSNGSISPNTAQTVNSGATKSFTITPNSNYTASTSGCGGSPTSSQSSAYTYTTGAITANCPVTASFTVIPVVDETPLQTAYGSPYEVSGAGLGFNMGYKFTPNFNGKIVKLGFNSLDTLSHTQYLYDYSTGNVLASVSGSSASSSWVYLPIAPVSVTAGHQYFVSSFGTTYGQGTQYNIPFPVTPPPGDISINGTYYSSPGSTSMPYISENGQIKGWADIDFQKQ
jgi:hypothetical protein